MARVLVAVLLSDAEAEALEKAAMRRGETLAEALEHALQLFLETEGFEEEGASTSSQALYLSPRGGRIQGTVYP